MARGAAAVLSATLRIDANSTSCMGIYQPEAPEELARYRKQCKNVRRNED